MGVAFIEGDFDTRTRAKPSLTPTQRHAQPSHPYVDGGCGVCSGVNFLFWIKCSCYNFVHTMDARIIKIGNSQGLIIPQTWLKEMKAKEVVSIEFKENSIVITPKEKSAREGWDEQFTSALADGSESDGELLGGFGNEFDDTEWTWPEEDKQA